MLASTLIGLSSQWFCGKMSREQCEVLFGKVIMISEIGERKGGGGTVRFLRALTPHTQRRHRLVLSYKFYWLVATC